MSSDWRDRANKRRDERHTKIDDTSKPKKSSKDTKRWCKGVEGREHDLTCFQKTDTLKTFVLYCRNCGKEEDVWWESRRNKPMPLWVKHMKGLI